MTHGELIISMGGAASVARELGLKPARVSDWRRYGVPFRDVGALVAAGRRLGIRVTAAEVLASHPSTIKRQAKAGAR